MIHEGNKVEIRHFHLFCGLGGGAGGFNLGEARVGNLKAVFRCLGGVDSDTAAIADFERIAGVPGTVMDLFDRRQYCAWHGKEPPHNWKEVTPSDIRRAAGNERPNIIFTSPPCKGFSGLLSEQRSISDKYQALNQLTLRGIWLALEAWADDPVEFFLLENVPRISTRGRELLDQIVALLERYGYATAETTHDCGELGGLAQTRRRFLLVARHREKVPPFLYEPPRRPLKSVGEILEKMPLPGTEAAGPMHRLPNLYWRTWVRLAFVDAGSDWRSLKRLAVDNGYLRDYGLVHGHMDNGTIHADSEALSVIDPRNHKAKGKRYNNVYRVIRYNQSSQALTGGGGPSAGGQAVADPRVSGFDHVYGVLKFTNTSGTIPGQTLPSNGRYAVADPRCPWNRRSNNLLIIDWNKHANTVIAGGKGPAGGQLSVADPRANQPYRDLDYNQLPDPEDRCTPVIIAEDNTWHRPFTTLELAALQSLIDPEEYLALHGRSDTGWRERIGNAVPRATAKAIADVMGKTLLLAWTGETFALDAMPIWVRPLVIGLTVDKGYPSKYRV